MVVKYTSKTKSYIIVQCEFVKKIKVVLAKNLQQVLFYMW